MCEFMDYLGWFSMSSSEQWDIVLKILGSLGAILLAGWTIYSWRLAKTIEFTNSLLQNFANLEAYWQFHEARNLTKNKQNEADKANQRASEISQLADHVMLKNLGLKKLRDLDKRHMYQAALNQKLNERLRADLEWELSLTRAQDN